MRLTLRTMLAYLDDMLEPYQTKQIGQKIQESPVAGVLVSRIREVMRRRRLSAPDVSGSHIGIDSNIVAQYLDNTLPPEQVADVERVLLSSDELLAEVAACHQVLTLILGEPCEVSAHSRERLYALGPVSASDQLRVDDSSATATTSASDNGAGIAAGIAAAVAVPSTAAGVQLVRPGSSHEIPEYLRPSPFSKVAGPTIVIAVIAVACVGTFLSDPSFLKGVNQAQRELAKNSRGASNSTVRKGLPSTTVSEADDVPMTNDANAVNTTATTRLDPAPPPDAADDSKMVPAATATINSPGAATVAVKPKSVVPGPTDPVPPAPAPVNPKPVVALPAVPVQLISNEGVLLRFSDVDQHWFLAPKQSVLKPGEPLACLEPYEAVLSFDQGTVRATVLGDSALRVMEATDLAATGLEVRHGRVLFQGSRQDGQQPLALAVVIGQDIWKLELLTPQTVCALEVLPTPSTGFEKVREPNRYSGVLYVLAGTVKWTSALGASQDVAERTGLPLSSDQAAANKQTAVSFPTAPDWTDPAKRKLAPLRRYALLFEKEFALDQPADPSMQSLIQHTNSKISELAVRGLALTQSYSALTQALAVCPHEEGRFAARDGLYEWLPLGADHGALLKKELETHYPPADVEMMYRLLWGYTREDGRDKLTSHQLVGLLHNNHVVERELADFWIERLIGRKTEYRATNLPAQRESQIRRIEKLIEDNGALVKDE